MMNIVLTIIENYGTGIDGISLLLVIFVSLAFIVSLGINQVSLLRIRKHITNFTGFSASFHHCHFIFLVIYTSKINGITSNPHQLSTQ